MNNEVLLKKINDFWEWFVEHEEQYKDVEDPKAAVESMDEQVLDFGLFSWEIGENGGRPYYFMISPNGNGDRLALSYEIIKRAPNLRDWEFRYCKPPEDWDYQMMVYDRMLVQQPVDVGAWRFALNKAAEEQLVEVYIQVSNMSNVDPEDRLNAAESALMKILGEEWVIDHLGALEVVETFSPELEKKSIAVQSLKTRFDELIES